MTRTAAGPGVFRRSNKSAQGGAAGGVGGVSGSGGGIRPSSRQPRGRSAERDTTGTGSRAGGGGAGGGGAGRGGVAGTAADPAGAAGNNAPPPMPSVEGGGAGGGVGGEGDGGITSGGDSGGHGGLQAVGSRKEISERNRAVLGRRNVAPSEHRELQLDAPPPPPPMVDPRIRDDCAALLAGARARRGSAQGKDGSRPR